MRVLYKMMVTVVAHDYTPERNPVGITSQVLDFTSPEARADALVQLTKTFGQTNHEFMITPFETTL